MLVLTYLSFSQKHMKISFYKTYQIWWKRKTESLELIFPDNFKSLDINKKKDSIEKKSNS